MMTNMGELMPLIAANLKGHKEMVVEQKDLASVTGNIGAEVLSSHCGVSS